MTMHETNSPPAITVVVVEDDPGLNKLICRKIRDLNLPLVAFQSVTQTVEYLQKTSDRHLLLVDFTLPDGSCLDILETLPDEEELPFIVMTGRGDEQLAVRLMKLGALDYLVKDQHFLDVLPKTVARTTKELQAKQELAAARQQARESELFAQTVLNSLSNRIAVLSPDGTIEAVNEAWASLARTCDARHCSVGANYLKVCESATGPDAAMSKQVAAGIRSVINGREDLFEQEYPCEVENDQLWYRVRVTSFPGAKPRRVVVSHEDLTDHKRMERRVEESERLLAFAIEQMPIPALIVQAPDQETIAVNAAARALMREPATSVDEISTRADRHSWDVRLPDGSPCPTEQLPLARAIHHGEVTYGKRLLVHAKEGVHKVLASAAPLRDSSGRIMAAIIAFPDITELEQAQKALAKSEAMLNQVLHVAPVGFCVLQDNVFSFVNDQLCAMTGYNEEELLGQSNRLLFTSEEEARRCRVLLEKQLQNQDEATLEHAVRHREGATLDVLTRVTHLDPIEPAKGLVCTLLDISERKQAEHERVLLQSAIDQAGEAFVITDIEGRVVYVNPAFEQSTGYSREEVIGASPNVLSSGEHDTRFYRDMWATIGNGDVWKGRFHNRRKDGSLFWEEATIAPVFDTEGEIVNYVATKRDMTQHLEMEERLQHKDKLQAIGQLAGGIAHDFNNLLTPILGFSSMLLMKITEDDPMHRRVKEINRAADRAKTLTQQLLAFSRRQVFDMDIFNLNTLITNFQEILRGAIREDIQLELELGPEPGRLRGNEAQLEQVLMNLAVNAQDAMPSGGTLTITTRNRHIGEHDPELAAGDYVELQFSDTGEGMDEATAQRLFEPFFTTKEKGKGTGLGLATCYGIVHQHDGDIRVESELNRGTTFTLLFPRSQEHARVKAESIEEVPRAKGQFITIVEDSEEVRTIVEAVLEDHGYHVQSFGTAADCLGEVKKAPDLLITDIVMPGSNGVELAEKMQARFEGLKVLFMSGYAAEEVYRRMMKREDVKLLNKPFKPADLLQKVSDALED